MSLTYIVLGAARSGTSLCAGLLNIMGVSMEYSIGNPDKYAPKGYYESAEACRINQKIYKLAWEGKQEYPDTPAAFFWHPPRFDDIQKKSYLVQEDIKQFIQEGSENSIWGFKNPATSLTLNLYLEHINNPRLVVVERDFDDNVAACSLVYNIDAKYVANILNYYRSMLDLFLKHYTHPRLILRYEDIKNNHLKVAEQMAEFAQVELSQEQYDQIENFVVKKQFGVEKYRKEQS